MALQSYKWVGGKTRADIMVSEGIAPATYFLPDDSLPDLWTWSYDDPRYKVIIPKGCILSLTATADGATTPKFKICDADDNPVGVAQYDIMRPFDKGTSQGVGWIRRGYIKYPYIPEILTPNVGDSPLPADGYILPGDYVRSDALGRFTKWLEWDGAHENGYSPTKIVGQVIDIQKFGVTFDTQLMEYMKFKTEDFQDQINAITADANTAGRPNLATADYIAMFETGISDNTHKGTLGVDDVLDQYGAQGMITIALML